MESLRIEPSNREVHFWLNDHTPETSVTLTQIDEKGPLIYRIQPTSKQRFAIWPSVGVVRPGFNVIVSIVLLERARSKLEEEFQKHGSEAESRQNDKILIEWCRAPDAVYHRLHGDPDQDFEILASFWSTKGYEFSTPVKSARQPLNVRYTLHNFPPLSSGSPKNSYPNPPLSAPRHHSPRKSFNRKIVPTVSTDASTTYADPTISCDDSLMLSVSTWDDDYRGQDYDGTEGSFPKRSKHSDLSQTLSHTESEGPSSSASVLSPTLSKGKVSIHRFQLQQVLRCNGCYQVFSRDPDALTIPAMSQACGHTLCRGCVVRKADEDYSLTGAYQRTVACPMCHAPDAFTPELHINHSLCAVIALLES